MANLPFIKDKRTYVPVVMATLRKSSESLFFRLRGTNSYSINQKIKFVRAITIALSIQVVTITGFEENHPRVDANTS